MFNFKERIKEKSTIGAVTTIVTAITGMFFAPEQSEAIAGTTMAILGLIAVFTKEKK